jgi:putative hemolysin
LDTVFLELLVIFLLVVLNGFFSCAELAIISIRKSRISQLVAEGDARAKIIEALQKDPHRLLAIVQIGVTVVGSTASAVGGVLAVEKIKPLLLSSSYEFLRNGAEPIAVTLVVVLLSYLPSPLPFTLLVRSKFQQKQAQFLSDSSPSQLLEFFVCSG